LVRELSDDQLASIMRRLANPKEAARELVAEAREKGGSDNITVVVVDVVDDDELPAAASAALATNPPTKRTTPIPEALSPPPEKEAGKGAAGTPAGWGGRVGPPPKASLPEPPRQRAVTWRVVGFFVILALLIAGAGVAIALYARGSYFVGLDNGQLTIYKGRPGGLLWFQPTVVQRTATAATQVLPERLPDLRSGKEEPSIPAARSYVASLAAEATTTTTSTTTLPPTTTTQPPPSTTTTSHP